MKKTLIGILLILTLAIGVSASGNYDDNYIVDMNLEIDNGYVFQAIEIDDYKMNVVGIGNFDVVAECMEPWYLPEDIYDATIGGLDYDFDVHGSGYIHTNFGLADYGVYHFQQDVEGYTVAISQMTEIDNNWQELLVATDGYMDWSEQMMVDIDTTNGNVQSFGVSQTAIMDAWGLDGQSMLYNKVDIPSLGFGTYQYASSPDIDYNFNFVFPLVI